MCSDGKQGKLTASYIPDPKTVKKHITQNILNATDFSELSYEPESN